jgi:hypothetical protein
VVRPQYCGSVIGCNRITLWREKHDRCVTSVPRAQILDELFPTCDAGPLLSMCSRLGEGTFSGLCDDPETRTVIAQSMGKLLLVLDRTALSARVPGVDIPARGFSQAAVARLTTLAAATAQAISIVASKIASQDAALRDTFLDVLTSSGVCPHISVANIAGIPRPTHCARAATAATHAFTLNIFAEFIIKIVSTDRKTAFSAIALASNVVFIASCARVHSLVPLVNSHVHLTGCFAAIDESLFPSIIFRLAISNVLDAVNWEDLIATKSDTPSRLNTFTLACLTAAGACTFNHVHSLKRALMCRNCSVSTHQPNRFIVVM